jgi:hypothetical protein
MNTTVIKNKPRCLYVGELENNSKYNEAVEPTKNVDKDDSAL